MELRSAIRVIANIDLVLSFVLLLYYGYKAIDVTISSAEFPLKLVVPWIHCAFHLVCAPIKIFTCWKLIKATARGESPESTIKCCRSWGTISTIVFIFHHNIMLFVEIFVKDGEFISKRRREINVLFCSIQALLFTFELTALICVSVFSQKLKRLLLQTTPDTMTTVNAT